MVSDGRMLDAEITRRVVAGLLDEKLHEVELSLRCGWVVDGAVLG